MTIAVDDNKVVVRICDDHAEEATVKSAREAYIVKRKAIDNILVQAKALGLQLTEQSSSGLVLATNQNVQQPQQLQEKPLLVEMPIGENVVRTATIDTRRFQSVGGVASIQNSSSINVTAHSSIDRSTLVDKLPEGALDGFAEMAVVEGRGGQPLAIPQRRVDKTGVTRMTVAKSTDAQLQSRFKKMADATMVDHHPEFAKGGYKNAQKQCPFCNGMTVVKNGKQSIQCPKCNGSGIMSTY